MLTVKGREKDNWATVVYTLPEAFKAYKPEVLKLQAMNTISFTPFPWGEVTLSPTLLWCSPEDYQHHLCKSYCFIVTHYWKERLWSTAVKRPASKQLSSWPPRQWEHCTLHTTLLWWLFASEKLRFKLSESWARKSKLNKSVRLYTVSNCSSAWKKSPPHNKVEINISDVWGLHRNFPSGNCFLAFFWKVEAAYGMSTWNDITISGIEDASARNRNKNGNRKPSSAYSSCSTHFMLSHFYCTVSKTLNT